MKTLLSATAATGEVLLPNGLWDFVDAIARVQPAPTLVLYNWDGLLQGGNRPAFDVNAVPSAEGTALGLQELREWARAAFDTYDLLLAGFTGLAPSLSKPQFDDLARLPACSVVIEVFDSTTVRCAAHSTKVIERLSETWRTAAIERVPWG